MSVKYNTVIIGARPCGTACGITLQRRGISNCIIDKAVFPRRKTCAGLVTGKTFRLINKLFGEEDTDSLFCDSASQIRLLRGNDELVSAPLKNPVRLVKRFDFESGLTLTTLWFSGTKASAVRFLRAKRSGELTTSQIKFT